MRLVLVTPAWRRYAVTRVAFAQRAHLHGALAGRGLDVRTVVVADDRNLDIADEYGFDTVVQANDSVGRKWNDGIEHAVRTLEADYVAIVGSDDWVHADVFDRLPLAEVPEQEPSAGDAVVWRAGPEAVSGRQICVVDLPTGRMKWCHSGGQYGVMPYVLPRAALEPSRFRPVDERLSRWLDGSFVNGLRCRPNWVFHDPHPVSRIDFKGSVNITPYDTIRKGESEELPEAWGRLYERFPAHLVEGARDLHERLARAAA